MIWKEWWQFLPGVLEKSCGTFPLVLMKTLKVSVWGEIGRLFLLLSWDSNVWVEEGFVWFGAGRWGDLILTPISCFSAQWKTLAPSEQLKVSESSKVLDSLGYHPRTMSKVYLKIILYIWKPRRKKGLKAVAAEVGFIFPILSYLNHV